METILLVLALVLGTWVLNLNGRIKALELRLGDLLDLLAQQTSAAPKPKRAAAAANVAYASKRSARVTGEVPAAEARATAPAPLPVAAPGPEPEPAKPPREWSFEELVGGKLPIWVGGISLVFAGFFLVRFTIDAGLLGPGTRSVLAAIFAALLIMASEFGGRLPKVGASFSDDPRIAQSLAGAGVALLYATLYMAAEIYGLIGVPVAFGLLIVTTILAFALALRHGPPTALMGLVGGFAAPWVAGLGPDTMPALLLYLGVFIAGLFGLALWRRWLWLLLLATSGGALWTVGLILTADSALPLLGLFILVVGASAVLVGNRFANAEPNMAALARFAPIGLALVQLAMLLPRLQFGWMGWGFYAALSGLAITLSWRDSRHLPTLFGALVLCLMPLLTGWADRGADPVVIAATIGLGLLFGGPAHWKAMKGENARPYWALLALLAQLVPFVAAFASGNSGFGDGTWGAICALMILPAAWIAWGWRAAETGTDRLVQLASAALAATMGWLACIHWLPDEYVGSFTLAIAAALALWAGRTNGTAMQRLAAVPLIVGLLALLVGSWRFFDTFGDALRGQQLMLSGLPGLHDAAKLTLLPALIASGIAALQQLRLGSWMRRAAWAVGLTGLGAFLWLVAKQIAAIDSPSQFITLGLAERVVMTQLLFLGGWISMRRADGWASIWAKAGLAATAIALFRLVWFDLGVFSPLWVPQALGPAPVANLGSVHLGLAAFWLWQVARCAAPASLHKPAQIGSLILMVLTALVTVRQLVQGNLISGATIETGENYLYSAALLALAIGWLAVGIKTGLALIRIAGLALLTVVTFKVFLIDAAALEGVLRILSFLGLGLALIGIGWAYGRVMRGGVKT